MFDARKFFEDNNIDYFEGDYYHKHCRPGFIQTECPRCTGNPGLHLGFSDKGGFFVCWRCGWMPIEEAIKNFIGVGWGQAKDLKKEYGGTSYRRIVQKRQKEQDITVTLPAGTTALQEMHREYLKGRDLDPDEIDEIWDVYGTGPLGRYKYRIIAPIYYKGVLVSYQGRDITDKSSKKYKACSKPRERIHHKDIVYGFDLAGRDVVVVEGFFDAWRLGPGAVATFGTKYTHMQVRLLSQFRRVFILFDETDEQALNNAYQLSFDLCSLNVDSEVVTIGEDKDPGEFTNDEASYLMRELLIK